MDREEARARAAAATATLAGRPARRSFKEIAEEAARLGAARANAPSTPPVWTTPSRESIADPPSVAPASLPARPRIATGTLVGAGVALAAIVAASAFVLVRTNRATPTSEPRVSAATAPSAPAEAAPRVAVVATAEPAAPEAAPAAEAIAPAAAKQSTTPDKQIAPAAASKKEPPPIAGPEEPDAASVRAAVRSKSAAAKSCVTGADEPSRAEIRFSSSGNVSSVTVSGWAASHGASACVQAAFKGVRIPSFSKPSFTVGTTIRP